MNSLFHYYLVMWKLYCLAGHLDTEVVKADSNVGRVDESSVGRGDTVGGGLVDGGHGDGVLGGDLGDGSIVDNLGDDSMVGAGVSDLGEASVDLGEAGVSDLGSDNIGGGVEEGGVSLSLSLGLSISGPLSPSGIAVSIGTIGSRVGTIGTIGTIGIGVSIGAVEKGGIGFSLGFRLSEGHSGKSENCEELHVVRLS